MVCLALPIAACTRAVLAFQIGLRPLHGEHAILARQALLIEVIEILQLVAHQAPSACLLATRCASVPADFLVQAGEALLQNADLIAIAQRPQLEF